MIAKEIEPGVWRVEATSDEEAVSMRWLFTLESRGPNTGEKSERPQQRHEFNDFTAMRGSAAEHWTKMRAEGVESQIFDAIEDVRARTLGLSCRHTGQEWVISMMALRSDRSRWVQLMTTPQRRALFASHFNFAKWATGSDPLAIVDGIKLNLETSSFDRA